MTDTDLRQYQVQHDYVSGIGGPWDTGQLLWLPGDQAAHINRDSPGALALIAPELYTDPVLGTTDVTGTPAVPARNRQVRKAPARKAQRYDRKGSPSDQGPIDRSTFKATKKG